MYNAPPTSPRHAAKVTAGCCTPRRSHRRKLHTEAGHLAGGSRTEAAHLAGAWLALFCGEAAKIMYILPVVAASGRVVAAGSDGRPRERERERAAAEKAALLPI